MTDDHPSTGPAHAASAAFEPRVRASFDRQAFMAALGARLVRVADGRVAIAVPAAADLTQQHGYLHAGVIASVGDTACGHAAYTRITRVFSGRPARAIRNRFLDEMEERDVPVPSYPVQNSLTRPIRTAAAAQGDADALALWAGQGVGLARSMPAGALMRALAREIDEVTASLHPRDRTR